MTTTATSSRDFPLGRQVRLAELDVDPYPVLQRLQAEEPVSWVPELRMWFVTRRADVLSVLTDTETFRSDSPRSPARDTFGPQMLSTDGDEQRRYKNPCIPTFRPRSVRESQHAGIEARAHALVDAFAAAGAADLRAALAAPLALDTVLTILGLPPDDRHPVAAWYDEFAAALANFTGEPALRARGQEAARQFREHVRPMLRRRERDPDLTLLSALVNAGPGRLSDEEILSNALVILFGGIETTESMICNAVWSLLRHPDQFEEVRADPALIENAVEESMRWEPAVQTCTRAAARSVVIRDVRIEAGQMIQCMLGAANRDPEVYRDPDRFDCRRSNASSHLTFGFGRHVCLGAALARLEARIAVGVLAQRLPGLRLDPERAEAPRGYEFRKPPRLAVTWEPA